MGLESPFLAKISIKWHFCTRVHLLFFENRTKKHDLLIFAYIICDFSKKQTVGAASPARRASKILFFCENRQKDGAQKFRPVFLLSSKIKDHLFLRNPRKGGVLSAYSNKAAFRLRGRPPNLTLNSWKPGPRSVFLFKWGREHFRNFYFLLT